MFKLIKNIFREGLVYNLYTGEVIYKSISIRKCIHVLFELERGDLEDHCNYVESCIENYEPYAEFYPTYGIKFRGKNYDWNNIYDLSKYMKVVKPK